MVVSVHCLDIGLLVQGWAKKPDTFQKISQRCKMQKWWWDKNKLKQDTRRFVMQKDELRCKNN